MIVGYQLVANDGTVVTNWGGVWGQCPAVPNPIYLPNGDHVHCPEIGTSYSGWTLAEWHMDPPTDPRAYPLGKYQFVAMLLVLGLDVDKALVKLPKGATRAVAQAKFDVAETFYHDDALLAQMAADAKLTVEQIDKAWMEAKDY